MIDPDTLFVSPEWLSRHLSNPNLRIFDASWHMPAAGRDARAEYLSGHIPGAVFFDIDAVSDRTTDLPHMLPAPSDFAAAVGAAGFGDGMRAIVYDSVGLFSAPRLWWTLQVFGVAQVSILAGGLPAWTAAGLPLERGAAQHPAARFTPRVEASLVADAAQVLTALETGAAQVVDARSAERFAGKVAEPRPGLRSGHMPGARNLPYGVLIENGTLKARPALEAAFAMAGINPDRPTIATCGSGLTACILSLARAATGRAPATVYDGSWSEWGGRKDLPIESGGENQPI
jgi:thiosulfate/3-mercaptopyruvate sulfurtransferase